MAATEAAAAVTLTAAARGGERRKIVVAVDEGEESMYALSWAIDNMVLDENSNNTLLLLYAKPPRLVYTAIDNGSGLGYMFSSDMVSSMDKYSNDVAACILEKAKRICKDLQNVKVETLVENGDPRDVICEVVEKQGAHLLVMGTHGYGPIKRVFLGSVSNFCAQNVKCPVLIVKRTKSTAGNN